MVLTFITNDGPCLGSPKSDEVIIKEIMILKKKTQNHF